MEDVRQCLRHPRGTLLPKSSSQQTQKIKGRKKSRAAEDQIRVVRARALVRPSSIFNERCTKKDMVFLSLSDEKKNTARPERDPTSIAVVVRAVN